MAQGDGRRADTDVTAEPRADADLTAVPGSTEGEGLNGLMAAILGTAEAPDVRLAPGTLVGEGNFRVDRELGAGGMGVVYLARDLTLQRDVALKIHRAQRGIERLQREAIALAQLTHPNVVVVHEVGRIDDRVFVAMEYVSGTTLRGWLDGGRRRWRAVVRMLLAAGEGLAAAHEAGLVHRDFKPENVLVGADGRPRVGDFGLVRASLAIRGDDAVTAERDDAGDDAGEVAAPRPDARLTATGTVMGTPPYMAPELIAGDEIDARADQFAFAVVLHEALYGERPFAGDSVAEVHAAILGGARRPATRRRVPRGVRRVIERGLARDRDARFPSMRALLDALAKAQRRRAPAIAAVVGAAVLMGAVAVAVAWPGATSCAAAGAGADRVWSAERRATALAGLRVAAPAEADAVWARFAPTVDGWAARYHKVSAVACEAERAHRWNQDLTARADWCLEDNLQGVDAFLTYLPATPADHAKVPQLVRAMIAATGVDHCVDERRMTSLRRPPVELGPRMRWEIAQAYVRALSFLVTRGQLERAEALVDGAVAAIGGTDDSSLRFTLEDARTYLAYRRGRRDEALARMTTMFDQARAVHDDGRAIHAAGSLIGLYAEVNQLDRIQPYVEYLRASMDRTDDPEAKEEAWKHLARVELASGRFDEAVGYYKRTLKLYQDGVLDDVVGYGEALTAYGTVLYETGDLANARTVLTDAIGRLEAAFGTDSGELTDALGARGLAESDAGLPDLAIADTGRALAILKRTKRTPDDELAAAHLNYAAALITGRRYDDAIPALSAARAIYEPIEGADGRDLGTIEENFGLVYLGLGRLDDARAADQRALAIEEHAVGADHPDVAKVLGNLSNVLSQQERCRDAIPIARRALAIWDAAAPSQADILIPLGRLGRCEIELGDAAAAIAPLERAVALAATVTAAPYERGYARWQLARALAALGREPDRARKLAQDARVDLANEAALVAAIDRWLSTR